MMRDGLVNDQIKQQVLEGLKPIVVQGCHGDIKVTVLDKVTCIFSIKLCRNIEFFQSSIFLLKFTTVDKPIWLHTVTYPTFEFLAKCNQILKCT